MNDLNRELTPASASLNTIPNMKLLEQYGKQSKNKRKERHFFSTQKMKHTNFFSRFLQRKKEKEWTRERESERLKNALRTRSSHTRARRQHRINNKFNNKAHTIYKCTSSYTWHIASTMPLCLLPTSLSYFRFDLIFVYCVCWWCICIWWFVVSFSAFLSLSHAHRIKVLFSFMIFAVATFFSNRNRADERPTERPTEKKRVMSNGNLVSVAV